MAVRGRAVRKPASRPMVLVLLFIVALAFYVGSAPQQESCLGYKKPLSIRLDDLWARPAHNDEGYYLGRLDATISMLEKTRAKGIVGVTPFIYDQLCNCELPLASDPAIVERVRRLQKMGFELALHGYNHSCISDACEFTNVTAGTSFQKLKKGKQYLEELLGTTLVWFLPPKNVGDSALKEALSNAGLRQLEEWYYDPILVWLTPSNRTVWNGFKDFASKHDGIVLHYNALDDAHLSEIGKFIVSFNGTRVFESPSQTRLRGYCWPKS
ncbi:DUF2334 domain-containing protein [archaeon]|nr:DUF2334 domain-containing protein [archaeon]